MDFIGFFRKNINLILLAVGLGLATLTRLLLSSFISWDMPIFLDWYQEIARYQGLAALAYDFSNYPPLYLAMLVTAYYLNQLVQVAPVVAVKAIPILFDLFSAFWVYKIVSIKHSRTASRIASVVAFLLLPTVIVNSAMWGQIDSVFTAFMLASLYCLLRERSTLAMVSFGLAFSIKFQSFFLAPFLFLILLLGKLLVRDLLLVPGIYLVTIIPAWIAGRPFVELLQLYPDQVVLFSKSTFNGPTFYALIDESVSYLFNNAGVVIAAGFTLLAVYGIYKIRPRLSPELMITMAAVSLLMIVYLLPRMHERYFYPAEVFLLVAGFYRPKLLWAAGALQITGLSTYATYLIGTTFMTLPVASLVNLAILVYVMVDAGKLVLKNRSMPDGFRSVALQ